MRSAAGWYLGTTTSSAQPLAHETYQKAVDIFSRELTNDPQKETFLKCSASLEDLEHSVRNAQLRYNDKVKDRKVQKWLIKISHRVRFYGNILDVFVQHHPEYVSLAWGAFKMLFAVVENHAKLLTILSKALSQVADSLPRLELSTILYPTERMRDAVVNLYVHLINFLIRAKAWYEEGTVRHIMNAFARPVELRYHDLIQEIESCTREIDILSTAGARAEQRDMHLEIQKIGRSQQEMDVVLTEIRKLCIETQALHSSGYLNTNRQLTDIQLNNIMESLPVSRMIEPLKVLSQCQHFQMRVKGKPRSGKSTPLTTISGHRKFKAWQSEQGSAVIMVKGDYKNRESIKALATSMVTILRQHQLPVIWTLKPPLQTPGEGMSNVEVIRDLIRQAIRLNLSLHSEGSLSLSCAMFQAAETPAQWFRLLASVIEALPALYLVINIEAIDARLIHTDEGFSWLSAFHSLIKALKERRAKTKLKIFLLSHGSASLQERKNLARFTGVILNAPKAF